MYTINNMLNNTSTHKRIIAIVVSISLVIVGLPQESLGRFFLATPGYNELGESTAVDSDSGSHKPNDRNSTIDKRMFWAAFIGSLFINNIARGVQKEAGVIFGNVQSAGFGFPEIIKYFFSAYGIVRIIAMIYIIVILWPCVLEVTKEKPYTAVFENMSPPVRKAVLTFLTFGAIFIPTWIIFPGLFQYHGQYFSLDSPLIRISITGFFLVVLYKIISRIEKFFSKESMVRNLTLSEELAYASTARIEDLLNRKPVNHRTISVNVMKIFAEQSQDKKQRRDRMPIENNVIKSLKNLNKEKEEILKLAGTDYKKGALNDALKKYINKWNLFKRLFAELSKEDSLGKKRAEAAREKLYKNELDPGLVRTEALNTSIRAAKMRKERAKSEKKQFEIDKLIGRSQ